MAFVRKRGVSHQIIETYREGGKVRQRVLANLGPYPSVDQALAGWQAQVADREASLFRYRQKQRLASRPREWNYTIGYVTAELERAQAKLACLEADIEKCPHIRSVKVFTANPDKSDTTAKPPPSAADRIAMDIVERLGR